MASVIAPRRVAIFGGGSFGTAMARIVANAAEANPSRFEPIVHFWVHRQGLADEINSKRTNAAYVGEDCRLPSNLRASTDLRAVAQDANIVIIGVPHEFLDADFYTTVRGGLAPGAQALSLAKGLQFDASSGNIVPVSLSIAKHLGVPTSMLAGPNLYKEMAADGFAEATIGYEVGNLEGAQLLQTLCTTEVFSVDIVEDLIGVDLCSALKNTITLACGFSSTSMGNTRAAVIRAGYAEIARFCRAFFPVREATFSAACGIGDLILSCSVGRGQKLAAAFVAAGGKTPWGELEQQVLGSARIPDWHNIQAVHAFLNTRGALSHFPLLAATYAVGFEGAEPTAIVAALKEPTRLAQAAVLPPLAIDLHGRRALVVGAAGGIGRAIVQRLLRCNARVVALDYSADGLTALKEVCAPQGCLTTMAVDLTKMDDAMDAVRKAISAEGEGPIRYVVQTAGIAKFEPVFETSAEEFDRQYGINVKPCVYVTQVVVEALAKQGLDGAVVHVSSQSSTVALKEHIVYSSSKAAVDHIARIQALEFGRYGVRVNSVRPTVVMTDLARKAWDPAKLEDMRESIPLQRLAEPEDVADVTAWLLSDLAKMVTGASIPVDGGRSMGGMGL